MIEDDEKTTLGTTKFKIVKTFCTLKNWYNANGLIL